MSGKTLLAAAVAATVIGAAGAAHADIIPATLSPPAVDGSITGVFAHNNITTAMINDDITFMWPIAGTSSASIVSVLNGLNDINFTSVTLNGMALMIVSSGFSESRFIGNVFPSAGPQHLLVSGANTGASSYSGTVNFFPGQVPEPATWAMLILGFGMIGVGLRMRRRDETAFA